MPEHRTTQAAGRTIRSESRTPAGPAPSIALFFKNYGQFKGYATRAEFWWPWLLLALLYLATGATAAILIATNFTEDIVTETYDPPGSPEFQQRFTLTGTAGTVANTAILSYLAIFAATISPLLAVTWRRFHDIGLPGPMFFLWLIPLVGWLIVLIMMAFPSKPSQRHHKWDNLHRGEGLPQEPTA